MEELKEEDVSPIMKSRTAKFLKSEEPQLIDAQNCQMESNQNPILNNEVPGAQIEEAHNPYANLDNILIDKLENDLSLNDNSQMQQ